MHDHKVAVITGGSSGIGKCCAELFAANNYKVYELSRRAEGDARVTHTKCDVTDSVAVKQAIAHIFDAEERIDLLVNCAGMGVSGAVEYISDDMLKKQFETNFYGTVYSARAVLPYMRRQNSGKIICISSAAAVFSIPFQTYYSASKAAINSFVCGLRNEVKAFGIDVCCVMPGDIKTGFTAARAKQHDGNAEYGGRIDKSVAVMEKDEQNGMTPESIAKFVFKLANKRKNRPLNTPGLQYKLLVFVSKLMPSSLLYHLIGKLYIKE